MNLDTVKEEFEDDLEPKNCDNLDNDYVVASVSFVLIVEIL